MTRCTLCNVAPDSSTKHLAGQVDVAWWISLFTYHGAKGSGSSPYVTGHINSLFPWRKEGDGSKEIRVWVGSEKQKDSFPDGMNCVPMMWNYLGQMIAMTAWAGSLCAIVSADGSEVAPAVCVGFTIDAAAGAPDGDDSGSVDEGGSMPGEVAGVENNQNCEDEEDLVSHQDCSPLEEVD
jgi:hypothetical protein